MRRIPYFILGICLAYTLASCADIRENLPDHTPADAFVQDWADSSPIHESASEDSDRDRIPEVPPMCSVHTADYHTYPKELIDFVGSEAFYDWIENEDPSDAGGNSHDGCPYSRNILSFLKHFHVSKEDFSGIYYKELYYFYHYSPDILFSEDDEAIEDYFRTLPVYPENEKAINHRILKLVLKDYLLNHTDSEELKNKYTALSVTEWTIPELIFDGKIPRDVYEKILNGNREEENKENFPYYYYNIDRIAEAVDALYQQYGTDKGTFLSADIPEKSEDIVALCKRSIALEEGLYDG